VVVEAHGVVGVGVGEVVGEKALVVEEEAHGVVEEAVVVVEEEAGVRGGRGGRCVKPAHQAGRYGPSGGELQSRQCLLEIQVPY
jgi:hypothetical protein